MKRQAKLVIADCLMDYNEPRLGCPTYYLQRYSYYNWAGRELLRRLDAEPDVNEYIIANEFYNQVKNYAFAKSKNSDLFFIVQEFLETVCDTLYAMNHHK